MTSGTGSPAPGVFAGGFFTEAGGEPAESLAHWDGTRWRRVGADGGGIVFSLSMFDEDGGGATEANLFVGGNFLEVGGIDKPGLVRWDGSGYSAVGGGLLGFYFGDIPKVKAMIEFDDDGPGPRKPALYVAGSFAYADGLRVNSIARWDGQNWEAMGGGLGSGGVNALAVFDADGPGPGPPMLYAGGGFSIRDPAGNWIDTLARFNGTDWEAVPGWGIGGVESLEVFDDDGDGPNRPALFVGALMRTTNGVPTRGIGKWDGRQWYGLGGGLTGLPWNPATDMQPFDEDGDPATPAGFYVAGYFEYAGGILTPGLARWGCPSPICFADCDESTGVGVLDIIDFLCFQHSFVTNDPYACNCDTSTGPNVCDIIDFLCFQNAFVAGCP